MVSPSFLFLSLQIAQYPTHSPFTINQLIRFMTPDGPLRIQTEPSDTLLTLFLKVQKKKKKSVWKGV